MDINFDIASLIIFSVLLLASFSASFAINRIWSQYAEKLNDEWAKQNKEVSASWVKHCSEANERWAEAMTRMNEAWDDKLREVFNMPPKRRGQLVELKKEPKEPKE
jgi:hypothetical protein